MLHPQRLLVPLLLPGIPISLSLAYKATIERAGVSLVGLNAPGHLLLAPAATPREFAIDPFVGEELRVGELEAFVGARLPPGPNREPNRVRAFVHALLERPMNRYEWTARALRNLRSIYASSVPCDHVRLLGAAERTLLVGEACRRDGDERARAQPAVPPHEMLQCEREVALCLFALRDEERAGEARVLLLQSLHGAHTWESGLTPAGKQELVRLLEHDYFQKARPQPGKKRAVREQGPDGKDD